MAQVEGALERAIERPFSRLFRSPLQPAEIEKAALREVEKSRKLGANVIYIANVYTVVISVEDGDLLGDLLETLKSDLATRLYAYASNNNYQMATTRPLVIFTTDDDMKLGEVYVIGENLSEEAIANEFGEEALPKAPHEREQRVFHDSDKMKRVAQRDPYIKSGLEGEAPRAYPAMPRSSTFAPTGNFSANPAVATFTDGSGAAAGAEAAAHNLMRPLTEAPASGADDATRMMVPQSPRTNGIITVNHQPPFVLGGQDTYVIGRQGVCDILIEDPQASRQHAQIVREGDGWAIADLDSTNGTLLNGKPVTHSRLKNGDVVVVGSTTISYRETGY